MKALSFKNDYSEGCHPAILKALSETNLVQEYGYGEDQFSLKAQQMIKDLMQNQDADIYFLPIGTQTNLIAISSFLRPFESVICAQTGHIVGSEAGAIEGTGFKVIPIPTTSNGKITLDILENFFETAGKTPHILIPRMLYISNTTEHGAFYRKAELVALSAFCKANDMILYLDGARLGSALTAEGNDLTLADIAKLTDAFYLGGTKNGALIGEALIIQNPTLKKGVAINIKKRGGTLAKGRLLGIQFTTLLDNNLYFDIAKYANNLAKSIHAIFAEKGYTFLTDDITNQIFPILPNALVEYLQKEIDFYVWKKIDAEHTCIRLITSWATSESSIQQLKEYLDKY